MEMKNNLLLGVNLLMILVIIIAILVIVRLAKEPVTKWCVETCQETFYNTKEAQQRLECIKELCSEALPDNSIQDV